MPSIYRRCAATGTSAALVAAIVAIVPATARAGEGEAGRVRVHLADEDGAPRTELYLERDGVVEAVCAGACDVLVPAGAYRLRVLRGGNQFVHSITLDRTLDVRWSRGAAWRPWVGLPLALLSGAIFVGNVVDRLSPSPRESADSRTTSWVLIPVTALIALGGVWMTFSSSSGAHVDLATPAHPAVAVAVMPVPIAGGLSFQVGGSF